MQRITFEFVGGPNDGTVVRGRLGEPSDAERHYLFSNRGTVGQQFSVASPFAVETLLKERLQNEQRHYFKRHMYVVTDRLEDAGEVRIVADYAPDLGELSPSPNRFARDR